MPGIGTSLGFRLLWPAGCPRMPVPTWHRRTGIAGASKLLFRTVLRAQCGWRWRTRRRCMVRATFSLSLISPQGFYRSHSSLVWHKLIEVNWNSWSLIWFCYYCMSRKLMSSICVLLYFLALLCCLGSKSQIISLSESRINELCKPIILIPTLCSDR